jgi:hypothetical protein
VHFYSFSRRYFSAPKRGQYADIVSQIRSLLTPIESQHSDPKKPKPAEAFATMLQADCAKKKSYGQSTAPT